MKKITIKSLAILLLILINSRSIGQTVSINVSTINNVSISNGTPINLQSNSSSLITLSSEIKLSTIPSDTYPGTIKIFYQKNSNSTSNIPTNGNGGNLLFLGNTSATRSFSISLNWNDFDVTGGYIYSEYQTYSGIRYKSTNYPITKNSLLGGGYVDVSKITNTLCCNQTIRYGDKPSDLTSSHIIENGNIMRSWNWSGGGYFALNNDDTVNFDYLNNSTTLFRLLQSGNYINKSNTITITVVPSPILSNTISTNLSLNSDGYSEFSTLKGIYIDGNSSQVNLNILQDPFHINQRGDNIVVTNNYRWEFALLNNDNLDSPIKQWTTINNETSTTLINLNPSLISSTKDQYFLVRRIAIYQNTNRVSNELKLMTRSISRDNNSICCDQTLKITSLTSIENPSTIIGSTPILSDPTVDRNYLRYNTISYQWQNQTINRGISDWSNIIGATSRDYLPLPLKVIDGGRSGLTVESTYNYRRIVKINYTYLDSIKQLWLTATTVQCYSNETNLSAYSTNIPFVKIYPNPTSSILNIESSSVNFIGAQISITNINGIFIPNSYSIINPGLITVDVSNLTTGTYFINILQLGATRGMYYTFLKN